MTKFALEDSLDTLENYLSDNKDWDFYWKFRRLIEETYGCTIETKMMYKNSDLPSPILHTLKPRA